MRLGRTKHCESWPTRSRRSAMRRAVDEKSAGPTSPGQHHGATCRRRRELFLEIDVARSSDFGIPNLRAARDDYVAGAVQPYLGLVAGEGTDIA